MKYLLPIILIALAGLLIFSRFQSQGKNEQEVISTNQNVLSTQTNSEGSVTVKATPVGIPDGQQWKFNIVLDTHSDDLSQDLTEAISLTDDKGNLYKAIFWDGSPPGGHHREGVLIFSSISPKPKSISLTVKNIGGIAERIFLWELGGE